MTDASKSPAGGNVGAAVLALPPLRDVIREHSLRAEKGLGQNFLLDLNLTRKIARSAKDLSTGTVFEIGPGPGGLTRALLIEGARKLIAIEYDTRAIGALSPLAEMSGGRLSLVHGDALRVDLQDLARLHRGGAPYTIAANLPYNIATPLLVQWMSLVRKDARLFSDMVLMFQKEVAQRIVAKPSTGAYGRLSVLCQWLCETKILFDVPPSAFVPPPKIVSSVVRLVPRADSAPVSFGLVEKITAAAFGQRRKMIRTSLKAYHPLFGACGLDETARAEDLSPADYVRLAAAISAGDDSLKD